jgi:hypothetical protein
VGQLFIVLLLGAVVSDWASAERGKTRRLHVTTYSDAGIPAYEIIKAADTLRLIFRQSDINLEWTVGDLSADEATLVVSTNIVSPEQERVLACRARRDIAIRIRRAAPSSTRASVLGVAQPFASRGLNVQIYYDRIVAVAAGQELTNADVLAHAIAHEMGHVLLRSTAHRVSGLMSGVWRAREYGRIATGNMFFAPDESMKMRLALDGEDGCSRTAPGGTSLSVLQLPAR